jgi:hypothetical protein
MAIELDDLRTILAALRGQQRRDALLVLGDALILFAPEALEHAARDADYPLTSVPAQLDPFTLGSSLGFDRTETLDVNGRASLTADLAAEVPADLVEAFDCVIDAGVVFWCFDPAAALRAILRMTKPVGTIVHITAVSGHYGRGYYNVHPLLLEDFYLANRCEIVEATFRTKFRGGGLASRVSRITNSVTRYETPGHVYLTESRHGRIGFGPRYRDPVEPNMVPNNVLGVFVFRKLSGGEIVNPVRTEPFVEGAPRA